MLLSVEAAFGTELPATIEELSKTLQQESMIATVVSLAGLLLAASVLFRHLRLSFRAIWKYEPPVVAGPVRVVVWATALEGLIVRVLPPVRIRWRDVALAALLCAVAWVAAAELLALYGVFFSDNRSAYGALGGLLAVMLWMNVASQTLFFGAEICKVVVIRGDSPHAPWPSATR